MKLPEITDKQFQEVLNQLAQAGLIQQVDGKFLITPAGQEIAEQMRQDS